MAGFRKLTELTASWRKPAEMLGIAMLAVLAACSRTDSQNASAPDASSTASSATVSGPQAAQGNPTLPPPLSGFDTSASKQPNWAQLTPAQRQVLAPLAGEWNTMPAARRKKWLEIAAKYAQMSPAEQQRMQTRMREWAQLTPEQRRIARESYARAKKLGPDQKSAKWEHYQSLSPEEKQKLAAKAEKKKNVVNLPRAQLDRNTAQAAKPTAPVASAIPVLPSAPATSTTVPVPTAPPVTVPAPAMPAGGLSGPSGDPLSSPSR